MAQANFTPIQLYYSSTPTATPSAVNLSYGELAINIVDGKLYYKDGGNVVRLLAQQGSGAPGGATTQVQYNNAGALAGSANFTFNGTTVTTANDASISSLTVGRGAGSDANSTAIGNQALLSNSTGTANTAVGVQALRNNLSGTDNTAVGRLAAQNVKGNFNIALGAYALQGNASSATGIANIGIGVSTLNNFTTATGNIAIGDSAMYSVATATNGIGIGQSALSLTSGNKNIAIGYESGNAITTGSNNVIIGGYTGAALPISATGSNFVVLSDGAGNIRAYWSGDDATFNGGLTLFTGPLRTAVEFISSASTITPTSDDSNQYNITALAVPATIAVPSGSPADGQKLLIRIKDNGTARALTWNAIYRVIGTFLPTTTVATKTTYVGCIYNGADNVWDVVAVTTQA